MKKYIVILFSSIFLISCANISNDYRSIEHLSNIYSVKELKSWMIVGKFYLQSDKDRIISKFSWEKVGKLQIIKIFNDFGMRLAEITVEHNEAKIIDVNGNVYTGNNLDEILSDKINLPLPVTEMQKWLVMKSYNPSKAVVKKDKFNKISSIYENGWLINYNKYITYNKILAPNRMTLTYGKKVKVKLVIKEWLTNN